MECTETEYKKEKMAHIGRIMCENLKKFKRNKINRNKCLMVCIECINKLTFKHLFPFIPPGIVILASTSIKFDVTR